jgi:hypothetical protein
MGFWNGLKNFMDFIGNFPIPDEVFGKRIEQAKAIQARRDYRIGNQRDMLKVAIGKADDNVQVNLIGKAIAQGMHLLLGQGVDFDLPGEEETPEDVWLNACWEANKKQILLKDAYLNATDGGCGFIKINPTKSVKGRLNEEMDVDFPSLEVVDPMFVQIDTTPTDNEQVIRYIITFAAPGPNGKDRLYKQEIEHQGAIYNKAGKIVSKGNYWIITDSHKDPEGGPEWIIDNQVKWDYVFAPMIHWKNLPNPNSVWGTPDVTEDLLNLQDKLNFNISNLNKIIRYHAHPKTVAKGVGNSDELSVSPDEIILLRNPDADLKNLELESDLAGAIQILDYLGKSIMDNMDAVNLSNMKDKIGQITNFALRVLFYDALGKMQTKREIWEDWLLDLNHRLLMIHNAGNTDPGQIVWPENVLPVNESEVIQEQKTEIEMGVVSKQTIAMERGRDWEQEQERMDDEKQMETNLGNEILNTFIRGQ